MQIIKILYYVNTVIKRYSCRRQHTIFRQLTQTADLRVSEKQHDALSKRKNQKLFDACRVLRRSDIWSNVN